MTFASTHIHTYIHINTYIHVQWKTLTQLKEELHLKDAKKCRRDPGPAPLDPINLSDTEDDEEDDDGLSARTTGRAKQPCKKHQPWN